MVDHSDRGSAARTDNRILYLAYGSNLHPRRLVERIGEAELFDVVQLPGWRLAFDKRGADGSAKANLIPAPGSAHTAWAAAYAILPGQLPVLDLYEGCGGGYETFRFEVLIKDQVMPALAYLTPSHWTSQKMEPFDWYRDLVAAGAAYHRLPADYIKRIQCQSAVTDPDRQRRKKRFQLLATL